MRAGRGVHYHVATQLCGRHGGEVRGTTVFFAAADDCDAAELTCSGVVRKLLFFIVVGFCATDGGPLWKLSSMGGIIL